MSSQEIAPTYVLSHKEIEEVIDKVSAQRFVSELANEIETMYGSTDLEAADRFGWPEDFKTLEYMMCADDDYEVVKVIGSTPGAPVTVSGTMSLSRRNEPGTVLLCDASVLTATRTATTTAVVLNKLNPEVETLSVIGAGWEGREHAFVLALLSPSLERVMFRDVAAEASEAAARDLNEIAGQIAELHGVKPLVAEAVSIDDHRVERSSDAIVTATLAQSTVLPDAPFKQGVVIAAIGTDMIGKQELDPAIYGRAKFVADELRQSLREGELQHAAGQLGITDDEREAATYHGSLLGGRVIGITDLLRAPERFARRPESVTVYDSTGFSGQDLAIGRLMVRLCDEQAWPKIQFHPPRSDMTFLELMGLPPALIR